MDGVWKGFDIDERKTLKTEGLEGFKEEISVAFDRREKQNLAEETKVKPGLDLYGRLEEGMGSRST